jgi:hypothetical protein
LVQSCRINGIIENKRKFRRAFLSNVTKNMLGSIL